MAQKKAARNFLQGAIEHLSKEDFDVMAMRYLALCSAIVEIADGASYLFGVAEPNGHSQERKQERLMQLLESVRTGGLDEDTNLI